MQHPAAATGTERDQPDQPEVRISEVKPSRGESTVDVLC